MLYYLKRGKWCVRTIKGGVVKFHTEEEAKKFLGLEPEPEQIEEEFVFYEQTDNDDQED